MFENAFNNIDRFMRNDEGLASELDYAEQTSWLLFLYTRKLAPARRGRLRSAKVIDGVHDVVSDEALSIRGHLNEEPFSPLGWNLTSSGKALQPITW